MKNYITEFFGTFLLVILGTGAIVFSQGNLFTIAAAFGFIVFVLIHTLGNISGGHFNPAVTTAMIIDKQIKVRDAIFYVIAQFLGGALASFFILLLVKELGLDQNVLGQTDFTKISAFSAFLIEIGATALLILIIFMVSDKNIGNPHLAGIVISLGLIAIVIFCANLTGASLNPARSFGPAIFAGGTALKNLWLYILAPELGAVIAAFSKRYFLTQD